MSDNCQCSPPTKRETPQMQLIAAVTVLVSLSALLFGPATTFADDTAEKSPFGAEEASYWAFQPFTRPEVPSVKDSVRTPIDAFILNQLQENELTLSDPAERGVFIRRATYDLWGLPPTPAEIDAFVHDESSDAHEKLIDRLLASPRYGERWGRYWLDVVRFSETAGFNADTMRPLAYKYRDYVIRAWNDDIPYDRFVQAQLAGDELFPNDPDALIATGFNRLWPDESNASNVELARQSMLNDMTGTVGAVFLGMSIGCAQCHDHKFDPILQKDFYRLQAFFAPMIPVQRVTVGEKQALADYHTKLAKWEANTAAVRKELWELELSVRAKATHGKRLKFPSIVLQAIDTPPWERTSLQNQLAFWTERQIKFTDKSLVKKLDETQRLRRKELKAQIKLLQKDRPTPPGKMDIMATVDGASMPATALLAGGTYNKPVEEVQPGFPTVLQTSKVFQPAKITPPRDGTTGRRAALAHWLTEPSHPLTSRVMVNRIWQGHFGRGIVANANDFGTQTDLPSHPELLDWLASEFVSQGWSIKDLHRLIMNSAVYRQSSRPTDPRAAEQDADNELYSRFPRRRLDAEAIRDGLLAVSGELNLEMYGPGVKPDLPPNFSAREAWKPSKDRAARNRRSIYILAKRNMPYPLLQAFDFPDMHESCAKRQETTIAPQALSLLNSGLVLGLAEQFAAKLIRDQPQLDINDCITQAYQEALGRTPNPDEVAAAAEFIATQQAVIAAHRAAGHPSHFPANVPYVYDAALVGGLVDFCHALFNSNEFLYID
ncbi:DUF1549 and DUF1553 domain-containing protein [Symmachiella dynata]|uniref:DUF1549 and DUF1553 domain-containing protein n=1 Tax=Symmachiella dynata TaxID=2527995 RepID=UPI0011A6FB44|nr:DUF1549 and DUF1553 domain-containing protein [Symmachiella dynata]